MFMKASAVVLGTALAVASVIPAAQADRYRGNHVNGAKHYNNTHHNSHGHWRGGRWIALGILGAAAGAAASDSYRDCYWRHGRRYCNH